MVAPFSLFAGEVTDAPKSVLDYFAEERTEAELDRISSSNSGAYGLRCRHSLHGEFAVTVQG